MAGSMQQTPPQQAASQGVMAPMSRSYPAASTSAPSIQRPLEPTAQLAGRLPAPYMHMPSAPSQQPAGPMSASTPGAAYGIRSPYPASLRPPPLPASSPAGLLPSPSTLLPQSSGRQATVSMQHTAYGAHTRPAVTGNSPLPLGQGAAPQGAPSSAPARSALIAAQNTGAPPISAPIIAQNAGQHNAPRPSAPLSGLYAGHGNAPRPSAPLSGQYAGPSNRPGTSAPMPSQYGVQGNAVLISAPNTVQNGLLSGRSVVPAPAPIAAQYPGQASVAQPSTSFAAVPVPTSHPATQLASHIAVTPPFAKGARPARCGECHSCLNKHLKKGCLRNIELRWAAALNRTYARRCT